MDTSRTNVLRSRRHFLRSIVEHAARGGGELLRPLRSQVAASALDENTETVVGSETDRTRAGEPKVSGEILAVLNDLSGVYET